MIDFTDLPTRKKTYGGANGNKIAVIYNHKQYMLKFPSEAKLNPELSYTNSCISEYLGCRIFQSIGMMAQNTLLGTYQINQKEINQKEKICVACEDFTRLGIVFQDFASLKNRMINSERNGYRTDLSEVLQTIKEQDITDPDKLMKHFWNMFIVDALIGNWDRHNGNWGFLYNEETDQIKLAPIFDCGSSLYPQADENIMESIFFNQKELNHRVFDTPLSALTINKKKINYFKYISSLQNEDCNQALKRIQPRINIKEIKNIIDTTPYINTLQKDFYFKMISERKDHILDFSLEKLNQREEKTHSSGFIFPKFSTKPKTKNKETNDYER